MFTRMIWRAVVVSAGMLWSAGLGAAAGAWAQPATAPQRSAAEKAAVAGDEQVAGDVVAARWRERVTAVAGADGSPGRAAVLAAELDRLKFPHEVMDFELRGMTGKNLVAAYSGDGPRTLLLGSHYDRVSRGTGAVDNASSCGVVLELLQRFRERPLKNYRVGAVFFDLEERGLIGSQAFAAEPTRRPDIFVNFDIFAYGDTLWVMSPKPEEPLAKAFQGAAGEFPLRLGDKYPPSDHRSFINAGVPALSVSLIDDAEIQPTIDMLFNNRRGPDLPRIFQIIHTPEDAVDKLEAEDVARGLEAVERCLRGLDEYLPAESDAAPPEGK